MGWTVLFFEYQARLWKTRSDKATADGKAGHLCYAERQRSMWLKFSGQATVAFQKAQEE
jgi:hypothetical protein